jgi:putative chitinase
MIEALASLFPTQTGEVLDCLLVAMQNKGLTRDMHVAARFCAQIGHETNGLRALREIGGERMRYAPWFGRGAIQITGKSNYAACAAATGIDCVEHPELLEAPPEAFVSAVWFYTSRGLDRLTNLDRISTIINGAGILPTSLQSRRAWYARACKAFRIEVV